MNLALICWGVINTTLNYNFIQIDPRIKYIFLMPEGRGLQQTTLCARRQELLVE